MKSMTDLVPAERTLMATLEIANEPLTFARLVQQAGYAPSYHLKTCLKYLVRTGLIAGTRNPAAISKDEQTRYALPAKKAAGA